MNFFLFKKFFQPILFHEKSKIIDLIDKKYIGDIESHKQIIDFQAFLSQFKNSDEVKDLDIQDLLNVDFENLSEIKEKCKKYIEIINSKYIELEDEDQTDKLFLFFAEKLKVIIYINFIFIFELHITILNKVKRKYFFLFLKLFKIFRK